MAETAQAPSIAKTIPHASRNWGHRLTEVFPHVILIAYSVFALIPIILILFGSFKERRELFRAPYTPPIWFTLEGGFHLTSVASTKGYEQVFARANVGNYFLNSLIVTGVSLFLILLIGAMASYALSEYRFRWNRIVGLYLVLGIMIPIRLGTVSLIRLTSLIGIYNTLAALILVYTAAGLPLAIFVMPEFMRSIPRDLKDAARVDGAGEFRILFTLMIPMIRPALATVLVFNMIPIWNDLWFPLTLAPGVRTVSSGLSTFAGQYNTDWTALLAALTLAMIPVLVLYVVFSRQFIQGLTRGAIKG